MPIICKKNVHSLKNTVLLCRFFSNFSWKTPSFHAHIWSKKVDSVKTTLYYRPKKSIGCPFFPISHWKFTVLMPIFCQQNVHSLKTHCSHVHILSKNINSLKNTVLSYLFFQICHEKPTVVIPIFGQKKRQFCQNYTNHGPKKSIGCHFFSNFSRKNYCSYAHIL